MTGSLTGLCFLSADNFLAYFLLYNYFLPPFLRNNITISSLHNIFEYLCWTDFVSLQFRATAGTGAILAEKDTRCSAFIDVSLGTRIMNKLNLTQSTNIHFKHNPIVRQNWNNWKSPIRILIKSFNQFCSGRHFKLETDKPQAITVYLSPCLFSSIQFYLNTS